MADTMKRDFLPFEVVFNPNWWHHTGGISFDRPFYFDGPARVRNDVIMRRVLHERYGDIGLGERDPQPRPVAGSLHVAGGFIIPALLGSEVAFAPDAAPQPLPITLTREQIDALEKLLRQYGIKELVRTGKIAILRGSKTVTSSK